MIYKKDEVYKVKLSDLSSGQLEKLCSEGKFVKGWDNKPITKDSFSEIKDKLKFLVLEYDENFAPAVKVVDKKKKETDILESGALENFPHLETVVYKNLTRIPDCCFSGCTNLKTFAPYSTGTLVYEKDENGNMKAKMVFPENVCIIATDIKSVGIDAFSDTAFEKVIVHNGYGKEQKYTKKVLEPKPDEPQKTNTVFLGDGAFEGCDKLKEVKIITPAIIGKETFCDCENLTKIKHMSKNKSNIKSIGANAFSETPIEKRCRKAKQIIDSPTTSQMLKYLTQKRKTSKTVFKEKTEVNIKNNNIM